MKSIKEYEFWFVTGSQHLYGPETLEQVAKDSQAMVDGLNASGKMPCKIVYKPTVKTPAEIKKVFKEASYDDKCAGVIAWMHTFSPSKMWINGLKDFKKPYCHFHTQFNREIPWNEIDMDFMNLNQSAHGDREHGFIGSRLRMARKIIVGYWEDEEPQTKLANWMRSACGYAISQELKMVRFSDNMRQVAVTEGDKVEAEIKFGYCTEFIIVLDKKFEHKDEMEFKAFLESIGDSIVVVSDEDVVKVHVHTNDPGLAIQKGLSYGSLTSMKIDNMRLEHEEKLIKEASRIAEEQKKAVTGEPKNLEEQALFLGGKDIYEKLIKGYTEKQWGRKCTELPAFIIKRLPFRFVYDNNYFNDRYQGIPIGGYTPIVEKMLEKADVLTGTDFFEFRAQNADIADKIIFTGMIDEYFGYRLGALEYRSVRFETETLDCDNYQGNAVVNYTDGEVPYTRVIEHKHFEFGKQEKTVISREYSSEWAVGMEPYYPVNDEKNNALYEQYKKLADEEENVIFGGRLGNYKYYDMDKVIAAALEQLDRIV